MPQLGQKRRILSRDFIRRAEFLESRHQRLRHKDPTIAAKMASSVGQREAVEFVGSGHGGHGAVNVKWERTRRNSAVNRERPLFIYSLRRSAFPMRVPPAQRTPA